jgi:hypothetical protein
MFLAFCVGIASCASQSPMRAPEFRTQKHRLFAQYPSYRIDDKIQKLGVIGHGPGRTQISSQLSRALLSRTNIKLADPGEIELVLGPKPIPFDTGPTELEVRTLAEKFRVDHILLFDDLTSPHADYILGGSAFDRIDIKIFTIPTAEVIFQTSSYFGLTFQDPRIYGYNSVQEVNPGEFDAFRIMNFYNLLFQLLYAFGEVQLGIIPKSPQGPYIVYDALVGSPAEVAGIQREDRIIAINGVPIGNLEDATAKRRELNLKQGDKAQVQISRRGETRTLELNFPIIPFGNQTAPSPPVGDSILSFGHDFHAAGVDILSTEREVVEILGRPTERREDERDEYFVTLSYPFGTVELEGERTAPIQGLGDETHVVRILITRAGAYGPRMTQVGDPIKSVLNKFPDEKHPTENKQRKLYGDPSHDISWGLVGYDDEGKIIEVSFFYGRSSSLIRRLTYKAVGEKVSEIEVGVQTN